MNNRAVRYFGLPSTRRWSWTVARLIVGSLTFTHGCFGWCSLSHRRTHAIRHPRSWNRRTILRLLLRSIRKQPHHVLHERISTAIRWNRSGKVRLRNLYRHKSKLTDVNPVQRVITEWRKINRGIELAQEMSLLVLQ